MFERSSPARGFMTPPPLQALSWKTRPSSSYCSSRSSPNILPQSAERKRSSPAASVNKGELFHVIHKVPAGDSPYVKAKQVQLVDKDPARSISMFWAAINAGDRVESALKDMALVMKQLNRSDEAIEAIKSFRHLCPSESQESLDNILVELYKRSGRADEEISMLHHKLKQIEDGVTFVGRTTKQARSQGKKIQITAEQEISRILGNLAWAYLQKGDYKTAEEHYRKALSFEVDRNKQCNLAICLMQMNRITEAKFLLQAVSTASKNNRKMDDSFTKSFERASQMLSEIESSSSGRSMSQCSPESSPAGELKKGTSIGNSSGRHSDIVKSRTENWSLTSEVEVSRARRRLYESPDPARRDTKVPYTKPKRPSWGFNNNGYQRETWGDIHSDPKPSFGSPASDKYGIVLPKSTGRNDLSSSPANGKWRAKTLEDAADDSNWRSKSSESHHMTLDGTKDSVAAKSVGDNMSSGNLVNLNEFATSGYGRLLAKKSWADIVEEEENEEHVDLFSGGYAGFHGQDSEEVFNDENVNLNIISQHPGNATLSRNPTVRRSLCFNPELTTESACKASNLESCRILSNQSDSFSGEKNLTRRNRLQVFQDITLQGESYKLGKLQDSFESE